MAVIFGFGDIARFAGCYLAPVVCKRPNVALVLKYVLDAGEAPHIRFGVSEMTVV